MLIESLWNEYYEYLLRYAVSISRDESLSQELVSETFLRASKNRTLLSSLPDYKVKAWLFRVLKNYFLDIKRKEKNIRNIAGDFEAYEEIDMDSSIDFEIMMNLLCDEEKELIMLKYIHNMKSHEISEKLGIPPGTVRFRLHTIINKLRKHYIDQEA